MKFFGSKETSSSLFLSLDLCFLSVVTRTSRSSLEGKLRERQRGGVPSPSNRWTPYPQQIFNEERRFPPLVSTLFLLYFHSCFFLWPLLCWSSGCCLLYKYIASLPHSSRRTSARTPPLSFSLARSPSRSRSELSLWMYTSSIRYRRLTCSFQYEKPERCAAKATTCKDHSTSTATSRVADATRQQAFDLGNAIVRRFQFFFFFRCNSK